MGLPTGSVGCTTSKNEERLAYEEPLNIILMIGDGMGVPQVSSAYYFGDGEPNFSRFKQIGFHKTLDKETVYFNSSQLSGELIPVFAQGKGAEKF